MAEQHRNVRGGRDRAGRGCGFAPEDNDRPHHRDQRDLEIVAKDRRIRELERDLKIAALQRRIRKLERLLAAAKIATNRRKIKELERQLAVARLNTEDDEDAESEAASTLDGDIEEDFIDWQPTEPVYDEYAEDVIDWQPIEPIYDEYPEDVIDWQSTEPVYDEHDNEGEEISKRRSLIVEATEPIYDDEEEETKQQESGEEDIIYDDLEISSLFSMDEVSDHEHTLEQQLVLPTLVEATSPLPPTFRRRKKKSLAWEHFIVEAVPVKFFCKTITASDTSTHGGFSVPRRAAEKIFSPLDFTMQPPGPLPGLPPGLLQNCTTKKKPFENVRHINFAEYIKWIQNQTNRRRNIYKTMVDKRGKQKRLQRGGYNAYGIEYRPASSNELDSRTNLSLEGEYDAKLAATNE